MLKIEKIFCEKKIFVKKKNIFVKKKYYVKKCTRREMCKIIMNAEIS